MTGMDKEAFVRAANVEAEWVWGTAQAAGEPVIYRDGDVIPAFGVPGLSYGGSQREITREYATRLLGICAAAETAEPFNEFGTTEAGTAPWRAVGTFVGAKRGRWMLEVRPAPGKCYLYHFPVDA